MRLVVDGPVFERETPGGIARLFANVLPIQCDLDPKLRVQIFFSKTPKIPYPKHKQISLFFPETVQKILRPFKLSKSQKLSFQKKCLQIWMGNTHNKIWLSTYFTLPPENWQGKQAVMVHDFIHELFPEHLPGGERVVKQKADAINAADIVICNSWTTCRDLMSRFSIPKNRVFVTHLAANSTFRTKQKEELGIFVDYPFLLYIGKRNGYKNFKTLFDAYTDWPGNSTVKLLLVGPKLSETEINTFQRCSVSEKIVLVENPDDEALCDLYNQALAFVYPSLYEGFGIPLLEAMQCHCPIIASSIPSTLEVAGDVPIYFEATDKISLLNALNQLSNTSDLQARADKGIIHARQYSWEKTAADFFKALQTLDI